MFFSDGITITLVYANGRGTSEAIGGGGDDDDQSRLKGGWNVAVYARPCTCNTRRELYTGGKNPASGPTRHGRVRTKLFTEARRVLYIYIYVYNAACIGVFGLKRSGSKRIVTRGPFYGHIRFA